MLGEATLDVSGTFLGEAIRFLILFAAPHLWFTEDWRGKVTTGPIVRAASCEHARHSAKAARPPAASSQPLVICRRGEQYPGIRVMWRRRHFGRSRSRRSGRDTSLRPGPTAAL